MKELERKIHFVANTEIFVWTQWTVLESNNWCEVSTLSTESDDYCNGIVLTIVDCCWLDLCENGTF